MIDYSVEGEMTSQHPRWTILLSSSPRVPRDEVLYLLEGIPRARKRAVWWPQQKDVLLMKDLLQKLSRCKDVVMDFCAGLYFTAKVCMLLDQHRSFMGCDVESELLTTAEAGIFYLLPPRY